MGGNSQDLSCFLPCTDEEGAPFEEPVIFLVQSVSHSPLHHLLHELVDGLSDGRAFLDGEGIHRVDPTCLPRGCAYMHVIEYTQDEGKPPVLISSLDLSCDLAGDLSDKFTISPLLAHTFVVERLRNSSVFCVPGVSLFPHSWWGSTCSSSRRVHSSAFPPPLFASPLIDSHSSNCLSVFDKSMTLSTIVSIVIAFSIASRLPYHYISLRLLSITT